MTPRLHRAMREMLSGGDRLASFSTRNAKLRPTVERYLRVFERSPSKALQARARNIRQRMADEALGKQPDKRRALRPG